MAAKRPWLLRTGERLTHETKETRVRKSCCEPRKTSWWSSWESKRVLTASRHHYLLRVGLRAQCGPEDFILKNQEWPRMKVLSLGHVAGAGWFSPTQMDSFYLVNYLRGPVYLFIHLFAFINVASFWHKTFFFFQKKKIQGYWNKRYFHEMLWVFKFDRKCFLGFFWLSYLLQPPWITWRSVGISFDKKHD